MANNVEPTGTCFDDAVHYIEQRITVQPILVKGGRLRLVHGLCKAVQAPYERIYAHAWVEEKGECWDCGILKGERIYYAVERDAYYKLRNVQEVTKYSMREVWEHNVTSGHYGPWEEKYLAHVRADDAPLEIMGAHDIKPTGARLSIKCPRCGLTSFNPHDVANRYCGSCHRDIP